MSTPGADRILVSDGGADIPLRMAYGLLCSFLCAGGSHAPGRAGSGKAWRAACWRGR